jgi:cholesterol transport system auxiliary component
MTLSRRVVLLGGLSLPLAGCIGTASAPPAFDLSAAKEGLTGRPGTGGQLVVDEPSAIAIYDSERIVAKAIAQGMTYLPDAQWADRLPRLVQSRMVQTFENSNRFTSVGRPAEDIAPDLKLVSEIRAFEAVEESRLAIVEISAKLIGGNNGRILRGKLFGAETPLASIDGPGASAALNESLRLVLVDLVTWV